MSEGDKDRCICCGAEFVEGKGFIEPHTFPCANERYGWAWTMKDSERKAPHRSNDRTEQTQANPFKWGQDAEAEQ